MTDSTPFPPTPEPVLALPRCFPGTGWRQYYRALTLDQAVTLALVSKLEGSDPKALIEDVLTHRGLEIPVSAIDGLMAPPVQS
jgi:hypothetical protein